MKIKKGDPQPLDCPKCKCKMGYKVSDLIKIHYTDFYLDSGLKDGGQYSEFERIINAGKRAVCYECNTLLHFKIDRS